MGNIDGTGVRERFEFPSVVNALILYVGFYTGYIECRSADWNRAAGLGKSILGDREREDDWTIVGRNGWIGKGGKVFDCEIFWKDRILNGIRDSPVFG